jgi:hypothetical protein
MFLFCFNRPGHNFYYNFQASSEVNLASYEMGTSFIYLAIKRPGRKANHSPPLSAEDKNVWRIAPFLSCMWSILTLPEPASDSPF